MVEHSPKILANEREREKKRRRKNTHTSSTPGNSVTARCNVIMVLIKAAVVTV